VENTRYAFWPTPERIPVVWPNGARLALWIVVNIEHFPFDRPGSGGATAAFPDVRGHVTRDYGNRMGIWRLMEVLDQFRIRATVALNSDVCHHEPQVIAAGVARQWEWMGHGRTNAERLTNLAPSEERALMREVMETITRATGTTPRGWLSPGMAETVDTPDILAEAGIVYLPDWGADDQPFPLRVRSGRLIAMPYGHPGDLPAFAQNGWTGEQFAQMVCDQFDLLSRERAPAGRVMNLSLHPYLIGIPYRLKWLETALDYITTQGQVWLATGGEIADWYYAHAYEQAIARAPLPTA
jgi:peptidoglycan/xylan/chitin deacetylase (PgdA/CDA1 family)